VAWQCLHSTIIFPRRRPPSIGRPSRSFLRPACNSLGQVHSGQQCSRCGKERIPQSLPKGRCNSHARPRGYPAAKRNPTRFTAISYPLPINIAPVGIRITRNFPEREQRSMGFETRGGRSPGGTRARSRTLRSGPLCRCRPAVMPCAGRSRERAKTTAVRAQAGRIAGDEAGNIEGLPGSWSVAFGRPEAYARRSTEIRTRHPEREHL